VITRKPLEPVVIRSLENHSKDDKALCPVRCLKVYRKRTKEIRGERKKLLIHFQKNRKNEIHTNTVSSWVKQLLEFCYNNPSKTALELTGTGAHEIRRFASTLVFRGCTSVEDLLKVGNWKSHSTFTDFYLKDLSWLDGKGLRSVGPFVAGQKVVINPGIA
jgi:hypothetical protein